MFVGKYQRTVQCQEKLHCNDLLGVGSSSLDESHDVDATHAFLPGVMKILDPPRHHGMRNAFDVDFLLAEKCACAMGMKCCRFLEITGDWPALSMIQYVQFNGRRIVAPDCQAR